MEYSELISSVRKTFNSGRTKDVKFRIKQLKSLLRMFRENEADFCEALQKDLRKPRWESVVSETDYCINDVQGMLDEIEEWVKPSKVKKPAVNALDQCIIKPDPYGVVLVMGAWNYPLNLSMGPVIGAIAAGNCVVLKPSELSPHTADAMLKLLPKYVDPDCYKVVCGGVPETTSLLKERFDYIFYTGGTAVGKIVRQAANVHLTPCTLELGGKSPVYIDENCNLETAIKRLLWGKVLNVGQTCIAPDYILASKKVESKVVELVPKLLKEWFGENPQESQDLCRIVNERHFSRLKRLLDTTSGNIATGGRSDEKDKYIDLTVLTNVSTNDDVMKEEIFGPLLPIVNVYSVQEAIDFINEREKPLSLYVFTEDTKIQKKFMDETSSGGLTFNETIFQLTVDTLPFGGVGNSGMGAYHGKASFDTFSHQKSVFIKDLGMVGEKLGALRYPPYKENNLSILRFLTKKRTLPSFGWLGYLLTFGLGLMTAFINRLYRF